MLWQMTLIADPSGASRAPIWIKLVFGFGMNGTTTGAGAESNFNATETVVSVAVGVGTLVPLVLGETGAVLSALVPLEALETETLFDLRAIVKPSQPHSPAGHPVGRKPYPPIENCTGRCNRLQAQPDTISLIP